MKTAQPAHKLFKSGSALAEEARVRVIERLNESLADGLDLHGQLKVAHWNVKGPHFAALHQLFETFATSVSGHNDDLAERAVALGGRALGTSRHVARTSRLADYPQETTRDLHHVQLLADRVDTYLQGLQAARETADEVGDLDSSDLLTGVITEFEKNAWMLRATLES